jgi:hypothetical protein
MAQVIAFFKVQVMGRALVGFSPAHMGNSPAFSGADVARLRLNSRHGK